MQSSLNQLIHKHIKMLLIIFKYLLVVLKKKFNNILYSRYDIADMAESDTQDTWLIPIPIFKTLI